MKICVIGTSGHIHMTLAQMKKHPKAEFCGIAPGSQNEKLCDNFGMAEFPSYEEMLDKVRPDVAVVNPIYGLTASVIKKCAERKTDVFSEKPVAGSLHELNEIKKTVNQSGIRLGAMHFLRYTPSFYHAAEMVKNGAVGEVRLVTAQKSYKFGARPQWVSERALFTGTIPWVGIHAIDWIYHFARKDFLSVNALHVGNPETAALCQFQMSDGVIASANIDYFRPQSAPTHGDDRVRVAGTKGVMEVFEDRFTLINGDGVKEFRPKNAPMLAYGFLDGKTDIPADEIFMLTKVALSARLSADTGKCVEIE